MGVARALREGSCVLCQDARRKMGKVRLIGQSRHQVGSVLAGAAPPIFSPADNRGSRRDRQSPREELGGWQPLPRDALWHSASTIQAIHAWTAASLLLRKARGRILKPAAVFPGWGCCRSPSTPFEAVMGDNAPPGKVGDPAGGFY